MSERWPDWARNTVDGHGMTTIELVDCVIELTDLQQQAQTTTAGDRLRISQQKERIAALEAAISDTKRQLELTEGSYNSDMRNAIAEHDKLEAENRALKEFVAADDTLGAHVEAALTLEDVEVCRQMSEKKAAIRQRLATDHGLPLPGAGEGGE